MSNVSRVQEGLAPMVSHLAIASLLHNFQQLVLQSPPSELLIRIAQFVEQAFQADVGLVLSQPNDQPLAIAVGWSAQESAPYQTVVLDGMNSTGLHLLQSQNVLVLSEFSSQLDPTRTSEVELCQQFCRSLLQDWQLPLPGSALGISLWQDSDLIGGILLLRRQAYTWTSSEIEALKGLADSITLSLTLIAQDQQTQSLQKEVYLANQYQALSQQLLSNLPRALDLDQLLRLSLDTTAQTLQVDRGMLLLLKYGSPSRKVSLSSEIPKARITLNCEWSDLTPQPSMPDGQPTAVSDPTRQHSFELSECQLCQQVLEGLPKTIAIADVHDALDVESQGINEVFHLERFSSLLVAPLVAPANSQFPVLGFWVLQHRQIRDWQPMERKFVESVASQVSAIIIHNQALRQVQTLVEERTAQLEHNQRIQAKLYEVSRQQVEQLRRLNELKDEFLSTLSHELKTPLTAMKLAIQMLRELGISPDRATKYLDVLEQQWTREADLINDLLLLQELESSEKPLQFCGTDVRMLLQDLLPMFESRFRSKGLSILLNCSSALPLVPTDPQGLQRVLKELLTNSEKFSYPNTQIEVQLSIHSLTSDNYLVMSLVNRGLGISAAEQPHIFDKFRRGQGVTQKALPGVGIGLAIVKYLVVKRLKGEIEVSSHLVDDEQKIWETTFTLKLPLVIAPSVDVEGSNS
jgi:signal transduction histidine kinase